jgi:hypothetical protein
MKTQITIENKAKFFAQYLWKTLWIKESVYGKEPFPINPQMLYEPSNEEYLKLKSLLKIIDEDAIQIAELVVGDRFENKIRIGQSYAFWLHKNPNYAVDWKVYEYLQSEAYAVPWMGLSVDEIVDAGWINIT